MSKTGKAEYCSPAESGSSANDRWHSMLGKPDAQRMHKEFRRVRRLEDASLGYDSHLCGPSLRSG